MSRATDEQLCETLEQRPRLLIAEDDAATLEGLCTLLEDGFDVQVARNGAEAVAVARSFDPELILLDVFMPGSDGLAAYEELSRDERTRKTPVIFLSAPNDDLTVRCLSRGAADYVAKPVHYRELIARLGRALRESRERRTLEALAQTDALTGLSNYRALAGRAESEFYRAERYGYPLSVVTLDLDHLKTLNDTHGHAAGNRAIIALAHHLRDNLRESDFAARFGGDEFVLLLPHQTPAEAAILAERLRADLQTNRCLEGAGVLTLSAGIAGHTASRPRAGIAELLRASDAALYEAKRRGRNRVVIEDELPASVAEATSGLAS